MTGKQLLLFAQPVLYRDVVKAHKKRMRKWEKRVNPYRMPKVVFQS